MNISFTGRIIAQGQIQMGTSQKGTQWSSCEYTIEELNQQYPARAVFQVFGSDKIQQFNIQLGEIITANIGLKAHQSKEGRWFNQLDCWKVERPTGQMQGQVAQNPQQQGGYYAPPQQQFPPQVNASGQATQQDVQYSGAQQGKLPF